MARLEFPRPASIEPNIKFWVDVFSAYSVRDFVLVDKDHVWRVYQVLHVPGEGSPTPRMWIGRILTSRPNTRIC